MQAFSPATLLKNTPTQAFFCEFCEIFKNTHFEKHQRTAASNDLGLMLKIIGQYNDLVLWWIPTESLCTAIPWNGKISKVKTSFISLNVCCQFKNLEVCYVSDHCQSWLHAIFNPLCAHPTKWSNTPVLYVWPFCKVGC